MNRKIFIVATTAEIQSLVAEFLGKPEYDSLVSDMRRADPDQMHEGSYADFEILPENKWVTENHDKFIEEVQIGEMIEWDWQLQAVLEELAKQGKIEFGHYLIEVE